MLSLFWWWWAAPLGAVAALFFAARFYRQVLAASAGDAQMQQVAGYVREGAMAYLKRQYRTIALVFVGLVLLLVWQAFGLGQQHGLVPFAFLTGGILSGLAGLIGMNTATQASSRTAQAAKESLNRGLQVAFRAGAVMGLTVVGLGLSHIALWFWVLGWLLPRVSDGWAMSLDEITAVMLCFAIGASVTALFARVGGGIFTKSADVGADLVGKTEAGIPEDDPRNPAVIADNVGDNVGDVAGMGADLFESYCGSILATMVLGAAAARALHAPEMEPLAFALAPMVLAGVGILLSILALHFVKAGEEASQRNLLWALRRGVWGASLLILLSAGVVCWVIYPPGIWLGAFGCIATGLLVGVAIGWSSEYYTSAEYRPTRRLAEHARTGAATTVIAGLAHGMVSSWAAIAIVGFGTLMAYGLAGGFQTPEMGLYGIGLAAVGMLAPLGITLATDAFGSIADNAGGNAEMTQQPPQVRERTDALDSLGNTTAATGKGFAIGSAALTALVLLAAFAQEVRIGFQRVAEAQVQTQAGAADVPPGVLRAAAATFPEFMEIHQVNLLNPRFLVGMLVGVMMVFVFCGLTMKAVGRAAGQMVEEVRRQFRELHLLTDPNAKADYARCVSIATTASLREMVCPALLAVAAPIATGLLLNIAGVMGLLAGALTVGFAMAVFMANAGGAWDNAKKYIEAGHCGGKGSEAHKAAVVGDTVGDPCKDTSGPSLNILIKLMTMVAIVFAGVIVTYAPLVAQALGLGD